MGIYNFTRGVSLGDVDPTYKERHFTGDIKPVTLPKNLLHKIQERFCELGFEYMIGNINGCFNYKTLATVLAFQKQALQVQRRIRNLYTDQFELQQVAVTFKGVVNGIFDEPTALEMNIWLKNNYYNSCEIPLVKFEKTWVRPEIADSLYKAKDIVHNKGGIFPTNFIACFRNPANVTISTGMKFHSLHNTALAFDYDEWRGMQESDYDYYFIESAKDSEYWNVYVRSHSHEIEESLHTFIYYDSVSRQYKEIKTYGKFINLTEIFHEVGLFPIKRKKGWENEYYYTEWWHFEKTPQGFEWKAEMNKIGYVDEALRIFGYIK